MSKRTPLKTGSVVKMPNQGKYIICEQISEGGLSLVYSAKTKNNGYPVIIKEFFPSDHARRADKTVKNSDGTIAVKKGQVYPDIGHAEQFKRCLEAFEQEGRLGSSAHQSNFQIISFADCGFGYAIMPRWSGDSCSFRDLVNGWRISPPELNDPDPVFTDYGRIHFALSATSSLLSSLSSLHEQDMLHLDISSNNVVWAGKSRIKPENGVAFLTDFGCSVLMTDGIYPAEYVLSYSKEYAAPEFTLKDGQLTQATDIYSVGRLLTFLCFGQRAFYKHSDLKVLTGRLHIPERFRAQLLDVVQQATDSEMSKRYQSAAEMQKAVNILLAAIPLHPINPDHSADFSLYSLKSMLEGSLDTRYSWAHELCDRRKLTLPIPEQILQPIAGIPGGHFQNDEAFLRAILPEKVFGYLWGKITMEADKQFYLKAIMCGNCPKAWKDGIIRLLNEYGARRILIICRTLLKDEGTFDYDQRLLFDILGADCELLRDCFYRCNAPRYRYIGLVLIVIFALLGPDGFQQYIPSPGEVNNIIRAL